MVAPFCLDNQQALLESLPSLRSPITICSTTAPCRNPPTVGVCRSARTNIDGEMWAQWMPQEGRTAPPVCFACQKVPLGPRAMQHLPQQHANTSKRMLRSLAVPKMEWGGGFQC